MRFDGTAGLQLVCDSVRAPAYESGVRIYREERNQSWSWSDARRIHPDPRGSTHVPPPGRHKLPASQLQWLLVSVLFRCPFHMFVEAAGEMTTWS
mmetsp:Transcript_23778/g.54084  ORF Transcript_23778/g.54084 Transcript_23778/m.54084 type:complete len:95 (+) Transcript_23778:791-1075(+)